MVRAVRHRSANGVTRTLSSEYEGFSVDCGVEDRVNY
jgi:hypothetical protein